MEGACFPIPLELDDAGEFISPVLRHCTPEVLQHAPGPLCGQVSFKLKLLLRGAIFGIVPSSICDMHKPSVICTSWYCSINCDEFLLTSLSHTVCCNNLSVPHFLWRAPCGLTHLRIPFACNYTLQMSLLPALRFRTESCPCACS